MRCTILIDTSTRKHLKQIGRKGQTYDDIIRLLLDHNKNNKPALVDLKIDRLQTGEISDD